MAKAKNLDPVCYGSSSPVKRTEFELTQSGVKITCADQFKPGGIGLGPLRETSAYINYADHCREVAKWLNKAAKIMDKRFEERTGVKKK